MKKIIELLRQMGVSSKELSDSASPEEISKLLESRRVNLVKEEDFKNLQKKLNQRTEELQKLKEKERTREEKLKEEIENLKKEIEKMNEREERKRLKKMYPDILPDLLIGKNKEEIERIAREQRKLIEKQMEGMPSPHRPEFSSIGEIEKEIERVKTAGTIDTEEKIKRIGELKKLKEQM